MRITQHCKDFTGYYIVVHFKSGDTWRYFVDEYFYNKVIYAERKGYSWWLSYLKNNCTSEPVKIR